MGMSDPKFSPTLGAPLPAECERKRLITRDREKERDHTTCAFVAKRRLTVRRLSRLVHINIAHSQNRVKIFAQR
uniref:Uncharacterized protein n=1 Tax=Anopheles minimus TaxID=112268 RepID=A0A182WPX7_9DIPT